MKQLLIAWAGVLPDADVVAYAWGTAVTGSLEDGFVCHAAVHHRYTHGLAYVALAVLVGAWAARRRLRTALLCGASGLLHLAADLVGAGPTWPIYPFWPVTETAWSVPWSIPVNDGPNIAAGFVLLALALLYARRYGRSPLEMFHADMDRALVARLRGRASPTEGD